MDSSTIFLCFSVCSRLEVHFTGFPTAEIQWFREGVEIQPSRDFQITNLFQKSFLLIPEVFPEDAGMITVRAINPFGMAECRGMLTVAGECWRWALLSLFG